MDKSLKEIVDLFSIFEDPKDKLVQLLDMAKESEGLNQAEKTEDTRIKGCTSQSWVTIKNEDSDYFIKTDSDALIVKGLLTVLEKIFNGKTSTQIQLINSSSILEIIGLNQLISLQRTNGFVSAIDKIQEATK
tara:strand:+ start:363 stop:761 length:399 start_codon:yes stop_codon:yes gene_type:complete